MTYPQAFRAAKRCPTLLNPKCSSRWVFFRSKDLVTKALGSEKAAVELFLRDPELLLCPRYDGLNPRLQEMLSADMISASTAAPQQPFSLPVILGGILMTVLAALAAGEQLVS